MWWCYPVSLVWLPRASKGVARSLTRISHGLRPFLALAAAIDVAKMRKGRNCAVTTAAVIEEVFGSAAGQVRRYVDILGSAGVARGLIGPREAERLWDRHILNSVAVTSLVARDATVVDVGSGAGLPGIPLAVLRPDLRVTLLEPLLRRVTFLNETVDALGLANRVTVVRARAEEHQERYAVVLARAVAPLVKLVPWCAPLRSPAGTILALKGRSAAAELSAAEPALTRTGLVAEVLTVRAHPAAEPATVVRLTSRD